MPGQNPCQTSIPNEQELLKLGIDPEAYCELCKKEFCSKYFLKTHRANIHGIRTPATSCAPHPTPAIGNSPLAWPGIPQSAGCLDSKRSVNQWPGLEALPAIGAEVCDICSAEFANGYALKMHVFSKHGRYMNPERPLVPPPLLQSPLLQSPLNVAALISAVHGMHASSPSKLATPTPVTPAQAALIHAPPISAAVASLASMAVTNGVMSLVSVTQGDQPLALNMIKKETTVTCCAPVRDSAKRRSIGGRKRALLKRLKTRYAASKNTPVRAVYVCDVCDLLFSSARRCRRHRKRNHAHRRRRAPATPVGATTHATITQRFRVEDLSGRILSDVKLSIPLGVKQDVPLTNPLQVHLYPLTS